MPARLRIMVLACALPATLAGCGGGDDGTIPSGQSDELLRQLDAIQNDIQTGNCDLVDDHAQAFAAAVSALPDDVDPKVRQGLTEASTQVVELSQQPDQCETTTGATGPEGVEETTTTEETTTEDEPTSTTEETTTTEPDEEAPPDDGSEDDETNPPSDEPDISPAGGGPPGGGGAGGRGNSSGGLEPGKAEDR